MESENQDQLETELRELIDQYLKIALPKKDIDDGIAGAAYYLLGVSFILIIFFIMYNAVYRL